MELTWHGRARFRIRSGGQVWWLDTGAGTLSPPGDASSTLLDARSSGDRGRAGAGGAPVIDGPGEYELGGVPIVAVRTTAPGAGREGRRVAFRLAIDGVRVGYVGEDATLATTPVAPRTFAAVTPVEVAIIPVGGSVGLGASEALAFSRSLEAKLIVAYSPEADSSPTDTVRHLCRELGSDPDATVRALAVTGTTVPAVPRVVVLARHAAETGA